MHDFIPVIAAIVCAPVLLLIGLGCVLWLMAKRRLKVHSARLEAWRKVGRHYGLEAEKGLGFNTELRGKFHGFDLLVHAQPGTPGGVMGTPLGPRSKGSPNRTTLTARFPVPLGIGLQIKGPTQGASEAVSTGIPEIDAKLHTAAHDPVQLEEFLARGGRKALELYLAQGVRPLPEEEQARAAVKKGGRAVLKGVMGDSLVEEKVFGRRWYLVVDDECLKIEVPGLINDSDLLKEAVELLLRMADLICLAGTGEGPG